jgi:hypothetical protein
MRPSHSSFQGEQHEKPIIALTFTAFAASGLTQAADLAPTATATQTEQSEKSCIGASPRNQSQHTHSGR